MGHHVHHTECFVLDGVNTGESSRYLSLLTHNLGLVRAMARSLREEKSKLRYSLQNYSHSTVSLVRGRDIWRVTGAQSKYNFYENLRRDKRKQAMLVRITALIKRMLPNEERNDYLFSTFSEGVSFVWNTQLTDEELHFVEYLVVLRILYSLGYVPKTIAFETLFDSTNITHELLSRIERAQSDVLVAINRSLRESHL